MGKVTIFDPASLSAKQVDVPYDSNEIIEELRRILLEKYDIIGLTGSEIADNLDNDSIKYDVILAPLIVDPINFEDTFLSILTKVGRKTKKLCMFKWSGDTRKWSLLDETNELKKFLLMRDM